MNPESTTARTGHGSPEDVVLGLMSAMETLDPTQIGHWLHDDVVYQNSGLPDVVERTTVEQFLAAFLGAFASLTTRIVSIASRGPLVFTERLEHHVLSHDAPIGYPGAEIMLRVAGWHEVRNGVVVRWSDYWDTREYVATMGIDLPPPRAAAGGLDRTDGCR